MSNILDRFDKSEEVDLNIEKYLTFLIDGQYYAYPISHVMEIIEIQDITSVPEFPNYAKGIINLRGIVVPIIDVRLRFNMPEIPYNERTCIIVLKIGEIQVGFIVDTVDEVIDLNKNSISPVPSLSAGDKSRFIDGVGKNDSRMIMLLNADKMLNDDVLNRIGGNFNM